MSFIERMQNKPQHIKARYAFLSAVFITGVISVFWVTSLPAKFTSTERAPVTNADAANEATPGASGLSDLFSDTKDQLGAAIDALEERRVTSVEHATETAGVHATSTSTSTPPLQEVDESESEESGTSTPPKPTPRTVLIATTSSDRVERADE